MKPQSHAIAENERLALPITKRDHIQGTIDAPITIVEYGDYECPYCAEAHWTVKTIQRTLGDRMCFAYRNFPLTNVHPHAETAAEAAEAAGAQGSFWEMHDLLFENQEAIEPEDLAEYAAALRLDVSRFLAELQAGTHMPRVREDFRSGIKSGVNGTPTFFINGVRYNGAFDLDSLLAGLNAQLADETR